MKIATNTQGERMKTMEKDLGKMKTGLVAMETPMFQTDVEIARFQKM